MSSQPLVSAPCRARCAWTPNGRTYDGLPMFGCAGCGSQWVRSQGWTPIDADGSMPAEVRVEASRRSGAGG